MTSTTLKATPRKGNGLPMLALVGFGVVIFGASIVATRRRISE